jgi:uncharacterized membrane protein YebE (DUF533 family)
MRQARGEDPEAPEMPRGRKAEAERDEPLLSGPRSLPEDQAPYRGGRAARDEGAEPADERGAGPKGGGGLEDILRDVLGGQGGGGLGEILGKLQRQGGGLGDILGQVLGQATSGVRAGAGRLDEATGASRLSAEAIAEATGRSPEELLAQLKQLIANNQLGAGVALGGLGALLLGTSAGRSLAGSALKLGSLALIGGLAYKAYQDYQGGQAAPAGSAAKPVALLAAPAGSGFEASAVSNEQATLLIRAMIAAAAADGRIDAGEQRSIVGGLKQAGLDASAQQFLAREIEFPATVAELAKGVTSQEQAVQVYTAARIAVDPDEEEEHAFLASLANALGIDEALAAHIDAAARGAGT